MAMALTAALHHGTHSRRPQRHAPPHRDPRARPQALHQRHAGMGAPVLGQRARVRRGPVWGRAGGAVNRRVGTESGLWICERG